MSDDPKDYPAESPIQRALRLKKAAVDARPERPGGKVHRKQSAGMAAGASKPAMRK
jgi:hypothetical protein